MRIVTIIQARAASTRLPGKVLLPICGTEVLAHVISRCQRIQGSDEVVVATSASPQDVPVLELASSRGAETLAGSESDVLARFFEAAIEFGADAVVRVTADCPMLDPEVSSRVVSAFTEGEYDYVSNIKPPTFPDGLDTEVFSVKALERAYREATLTSHREHVTPYFWREPGRFRVANVENDVDLSHLRWTLDGEADLEMMRRLCDVMDAQFKDASMQDFIKALEAHPSIAALNSGEIRNESMEAQFVSEGGGSN